MIEAVHGIPGPARLFGVLAGALLLACAPRPPVHPSGFLGDYSDFVRASDESETLIYERPGLDLRPYKRVLLDPVQVALAPEAADRPVNPAQLTALAKYLEDAIVIALRDAYPLAEEPGEDVLRLRAALVDVIPTRPALNTVGTLALPARAASAAKRAITGTDLFVGQVAIEAELLDSQTGERLLAIVDRKAGGKFRLKEGMTTWGQVARGLREWAVQFRLRMDREHRRQDPVQP